MADEKDQEPEFEAIWRPEEILGLLRAVEMERVALAIAFPGTAGRYTALVIGLEPDEGRFWLDSLTPEGGDAIIEQGREFAFQVSTQGAEIRGKTKRIGEGRDEHGTFHVVELPSELRCRFRRTFYRAPVPSHLQGEVILAEGSGRVLAKGSLADLSPQGFGARIKLLDAQDEPLLAQGGEALKCRLKIPAMLDVEVPMNVRQLRRMERGDWRLGARFVDLDPRSERQIEKAVAAVARLVARGGK